MYFAKFYSIMCYGIIFWGGYQTATRVFTLQKLVIRNIYLLPFRSSCRQIFIKEKLLTLTSLYIYYTVLHIRDQLHTLPTHSDLHQYNTRGKNNILVPKVNLNKSKYNPFIMGSKFYNHLPLYLKDINDNKIFKNQLKQYLINKGFYTIDEFLNNIG